jgi:hypothetical protein
VKLQQGLHARHGGDATANDAKVIIATKHIGHGPRERSRITKSQAALQLIIANAMTLVGGSSI